LFLAETADIVPNIVQEVFAAKAPTISTEDLDSLFLYAVPEDVGGDACT